jgi:hypothetical protein
MIRCGFRPSVESASAPNGSSFCEVASRYRFEALTLIRELRPLDLTIFFASSNTRRACSRFVAMSSLRPGLPSKNVT